MSMEDMHTTTYDSNDGRFGFCDFAKLYTNFRKQYPEVTEMRFYTDELVKMEEEGEGSTHEGTTKVD